MGAPAVRVGHTVYVSGQIGRDDQRHMVEGSEAQIVQAFENLRRVLEAAGAGFADVVDLTTFHTDMRELPLFMRVKDRYLTEFVTDFIFPAFKSQALYDKAWTAVGVPSLGGAPGCIVEIKAVAVLASRPE